MVIKYYIKKEEGISLIRPNTSFHYQENAREMVIKYIKKDDTLYSCTFDQCSFNSLRNIMEFQAHFPSYILA